MCAKSCTRTDLLLPNAIILVELGRRGSVRKGFVRDAVALHESCGFEAGLQRLLADAAGLASGSLVDAKISVIFRRGGSRGVTREVKIWPTLQ